MKLFEVKWKIINGESQEDCGTALVYSSESDIKRVLSIELGVKKEQVIIIKSEAVKNRAYIGE